MDHLKRSLVRLVYLTRGFFLIWSPRILPGWLKRKRNGNNEVPSLLTQDRTQKSGELKLCSIDVVEGSVLNWLTWTEQVSRTVYGKWRSTGIARNGRDQINWAFSTGAALVEVWYVNIGLGLKLGCSEEAEEFDCRLWIGPIGRWLENLCWTRAYVGHAKREERSCRCG